jgi:trafficking protein particle complex subunit 10
VLGQAVDEALDGFPQYGPNRNRLIAHMIQALESDSNWVELYGITGELKVPASDNDATPKEVQNRIREVGCLSTARVIARICGRLSFPRS